MKSILGWIEYLGPLVCTSGNTHVMKANNIIAIKWTSHGKNDCKLRSKQTSDSCEKINVLCAYEVFHPSLPFLIHRYHEEHTWEQKGLCVVSCAHIMDSTLPLN